MKKLLPLLIAFFLFACGETKKTELEEIQEKIDEITTPSETTESKTESTYQLSDIVCEMSKDFIKQDLNYPKSADFSILDCSVENNSDGSYTILRKVGAQNAFGVESEFIYKVSLAYTGGIEVDIKNWKLISIRSEEVK